MGQFDLSGKSAPKNVDALRLAPVSDQVSEGNGADRDASAHSSLAADNAAGSSPYFEAAENSSGLGIAAPAEISAMRWHWGAFFLAPAWCAANGFNPLGYVYDLLIVVFLLTPFCYGAPYNGGIFLAALVAMAAIGRYLGIHGYEIAWKNRQFKSIDDFVQIQKKWSAAGLSVALPLNAVIIVCFGWMVSKTISRPVGEASVNSSQSVQTPAPGAQRSPYQQVPASVSPPSELPANFGGPPSGSNGPRIYYRHPVQQYAPSATAPGAGASAPDEYGLNPTAGSPGAMGSQPSSAGGQGSQPQSSGSEGQGDAAISGQADQSPSAAAGSADDQAGAPGTDAGTASGAPPDQAPDPGSQTSPGSGASGQQ